jgi:hypothetical protein
MEKFKSFWRRAMSFRNMGVFALSFFALTISMVVYGWVTHKEPGLLTGCDSEEGTVDLGGDCYPVQWEVSRLPLQVASDKYQDTSGAVAQINQEVGFELLTTTIRDRADIRITEGPWEEGRPLSGGWTLFYRDGGELYCEIRTWNLTSMMSLHYGLKHELYHALGLAHDPFRASIMFPELPESEDLRLAPRLMDSDRRILRLLYFREGVSMRD